MTPEELLLLRQMFASGPHTKAHRTSVSPSRWQSKTVREIHLGDRVLKLLIKHSVLDTQYNAESGCYEKKGSFYE